MHGNWLFILDTNFILSFITIYINAFIDKLFVNKFINSNFIDEFILYLGHFSVWLIGFLVEKKKRK